MSEQSGVTEMAEGAVTFLDVLGWKGVWTREGGPGDAVRRLRKLLAAAHDEAASVAEMKKQRGVTTEVKSVSDTIVLQTAGKADFVLELHGVICKRLICQSISEQLPLRGATSYGLFLPGTGTGDTIVVGPAVDEAASWHEECDWIGVILTPRASLYLADEAAPELGWVSGSVPLKSARFKSLMRLDWTHAWKGGAGALKDAFKKMGPLGVEIAPKYLNTLAFYEELQSKEDDC